MLAVAATLAGASLGRAPLVVYVAPILPVDGRSPSSEDEDVCLREAADSAAQASLSSAGERGGRGSPVRQNEIVVHALATLKSNAVVPVPGSASRVASSFSSSTIELSETGQQVTELPQGAVIQGRVASYSLVRKVEPFVIWTGDNFRRFRSSPVSTSQGFRDNAGFTPLLAGLFSKSLPVPEGTSKALVSNFPAGKFQADRSLTEIHSLEYQEAWRRCMRPKVVQDAIDDAVGSDSFDKYRLRTKFGVGGQGEVWQAVQVDNSASSNTGETSSRAQNQNEDSDEEEEEEEEVQGGGGGGGGGGEGLESDDTSHDKDGPSERPEEENRQNTFVLKRVFVEKGDAYRLAGLREATFGKRLQGHIEIAQFIEAFNHTTTTGGGQQVKDMWLVFRHEGSSLDSLLYSRVEAGETLMLEPSALWQRMRRDFDGALVRREIIKQIVEGLAVVASNGLAHRDIKPSNILISEVDKSQEPGRRRRKRRFKKGTDRQPVGFQVKIADFGSAVDIQDSALNARLYGDFGPTEAEETRFYRPPEAFLGGVNRAHFPYLANDQSSLDALNSALPFHAFDMWSLGVVALEMFLGTALVFEIDARSQTRIDADIQRTAYLHGNPQAVRELRYALKALENFGIGPLGQANKTRFNETITKRDPFRRGLYFFGNRESFRDEDEMRIHGNAELDFLWKLLSWSPYDRPTAEDMLAHPYLTV